MLSLQAIQWITCGERIDMVMDSEECEQTSAVGIYVLRKNDAKYKPYSAVSEIQPDERGLITCGGRCGANLQIRSMCSLRLGRK